MNYTVGGELKSGNLISSTGEYLHTKSCKFHLHMLDLAQFPPIKINDTINHEKNIGLKTREIYTRIIT
jgi:hypothetical protein